MKRAGLTRALVSLAAIGLAGGMAPPLGVSAVEAQPPALNCPSNVCQTAAGPVGVVFGQKAMLAVSNYTDEPVFVLIAFVDAATGEVRAKSRGEILEPGEGTSFEFVCPSDPSRVEVIAGLRVSFIRPPLRGTIGSSFQVVDSDTGKTMVYEQLPTRGRIVTGYEWRPEAHNWAPAASKWTFDTITPDWGSVTPR